MNPLLLDADNSSVKQFVKKQQAERILSVYDPTLIMQLFFIFACSWVGMDVIDHHLILTWVLLHIVILSVRKVLMAWHIRNSAEAVLSGMTEKATLFLVICSSLLWGSVAFVLDFNAYPQESVFLIAVNLGIGVGSTVLGAVWFRYCLVYLIPFMSLFIISFLIGIPEQSITLALVFVGFAIYLIRMVQMNFENNVQNLSLRKKNEILAQSTNQFIAAASHDLRQPTQALSLFISALESNSNTINKAHILEQLKRSSHALNELLNQILDISKLNANSLETIIEPVNLEPLFVRLSDTFTAVAEQKGVTLSFSANQLWVMTDIVLFERLLANLIDNAVNYTDTGSIRIVAAENGENLTYITIQDTGIGISDSEQVFIFDPFYQVDNSARNREKGVGLGLSIVKLTSQKLNIPLTLNSALGKGSTFSLQLPAAQPITIKSDEEDFSPAWQITNKHVLIVDDNESVREGLQSQLSTWNMSVLLAEDNASALQLLTEGTVIDLVISDFRLECKDTGLNVVRNVRSKLGKPNLPAIILSGDTAAERLDQVNRQGLTMLHKPIKAAQLRSAIQRELAKSDS